MAKLDVLYGYVMVIPPGLLGNPPPDGYLIDVRPSGVTIARVPPSLRVVGN
jgi:hypothetical protein